MTKLGEKEARKLHQESLKKQGDKLHSYKFFYIPCWIGLAKNLMQFAEYGLKEQKKILKSFFPQKVRKGIIQKSKYDPNDLNLDPPALLYALALENLFKAILIKQGKIKSHREASEKPRSHYLSKKKVPGYFQVRNEQVWSFYNLIFTPA